MIPTQIEVLSSFLILFSLFGPPTDLRQFTAQRINVCRLIPEMEGGTVGPSLVWSVDTQIQPVGLDQLVFGNGVIDWLAIPGADDPSWNVLHEFALLFAIDAILLEELAIAFSDQQWHDGKTSGSRRKNFIISLKRRAEATTNLISTCSRSYFLRFWK